MNKWRDKFYELFRHRSDEIRKALPVNVYRLSVMAWILGVINVIHIVIFWLNVPDYPEQIILWYHAIIVIHAITLLINIMAGVTALYLVKTGRTTGRSALFYQYVYVCIALLFGISLCVADQLISPSINPLFIASIGIAVVCLIPPLHALPIYAASFIVFYSTVPLTQPVPELLEHIRISVTAIGLGFGLSFIMWHNFLIRVRQEQQIAEQNKTLAAKNKRLEYIASHDFLTGILNREKFVEMAETEINSMKRYPHESCLIVFDIDEFKKINDDYGHPVGDQVLQEVVGIIKPQLSNTDSFARFGGEEFLILLPHTSLQNSVLVAEKLRELIRNHLFTEKQLTVTASFGVARLKANGPESFPSSYKAADQALYQVKQEGRNGVRFHE